MSASAVALSVAGSDSGGGAGIQADLRVMRRLGVLGTTAITALTAQNLDGVRDVQGTHPSTLTAQIDAVFEGFEVGAVKTGMLLNAELVRATVDALGRRRAPIVVDPVMVATSGARLLSEDAVVAYRPLLEQATLVTPNLDEADVLMGRVIDRAELREEAVALRAHLGCDVLLKGGHLEGDPVDVLAIEGATQAFAHTRVQGANTHGSGCMVSAAIASHLALGHTLADAVERSLAFVHDALHRGARGSGPRLADIEHATVELAHLTRL